MTKSEKQHLATDQRKNQILIWIAGSVDFFISGLPGHTPADIDAGIEHAIDCYLNRRESPGSAIPSGVHLARQRIKQRQAAAVSRAVAVKFLAARRRHIY
jgi:hypothetical protein